MIQTKINDEAITINNNLIIRAAPERNSAPALAIFLFCFAMMLLLSLMPTVSALALDSATSTHTQENKGRLSIISLQQPDAQDAPVIAQVSLFSAGSVTALQDHRIEHVFSLVNSGKVALTITRIQPSCGCTNVVVDSGQPEQLPYVLMAGHQIQIRATVNLTYLRPGQLDKYIYVYLTDQAVPAATLEITATLKPAVTFLPESLTFGHITAGTTLSRIMTLTLNPELISSLNGSRVVSTNPDLLVQQLDPPAGNAKRLSEGLKLSGRQPRNIGQDAITRTYEIKLSPKARLGILSGAIMWIPGGTGDNEGSTIVSVPVAGEVRGGVTSSPLSILFGTVRQGTIAHQRIMLTGKSGNLMKGLTVSCASRFLSAHLFTQDGQPFLDSVLISSSPTGQSREEEQTKAKASGTLPRTLMLEIDLGADAPVGGLTTQVIVRLMNNEELVLPVYVNIS